MLDPKFIRENVEEVKRKVASKNINPICVDEFLEIDSIKKSISTIVQQLRTQRNKFAEERDIEGGKRVKEGLKTAEPELRRIEKEWKKRLYDIPNLPTDDVPIGRVWREE